MPCEHWSAIAETALHYQPCFHHKSKTQPHASCCEKNQLYPTQNQHIHLVCEVFIFETDF